MQTRGGELLAMRHDGPDSQSLRPFFAPASVAVIGATDRDGSVGKTVLDNLLATFQGRIYPVNPHRSEVGRLHCYASVGAIPEQVDLVVIAIPASRVPSVVAECVAAKSKAIVVISAGFKEKGPQGLALEQQIRSKLRGSSTRLIGPNCLGIMNPSVGLNATFAGVAAQPGSVAFLSQSGALASAILDWSADEHMGFSAIVSTGSMLDVEWGDLLSYFGNDENTRSIVLYMESIGDAHSFLSAARKIAPVKPIVVVKAGRSAAGSRAAASHTGAMTGSDEAYDAAFRRCGVLRVQNIGDLFHMADVLGKQPQPRGPRLTILTNAGGPGVLATDALLESDGELASLSPESEKTLSSFLPSHWSHANPIDILGDADAERYGHALNVALADPQSDGLLLILAPQGMTDARLVAERVRIRNTADKPVLASWMGGAGVAVGRQTLQSCNVPVFSYPDDAVRTFQFMWNHSKNLLALQEAPLPVTERPATQRHREVDDIVNHALSANRTLLSEVESKAILETYRIPTVPTRVAKDEGEAVARAEELGYPVVLKLHSETVTHKSDVGGVRLNLTSGEEVRRAYRAIADAAAQIAGPGAFLGVTVQPMIQSEGIELIMGSVADEQFGPLLLFGSGGKFVEIYRDRAIELPPLNAALARQLRSRTKISRALRGIRGSQPIDEDSLDSVMVHFAELVIEHPRIREIEINPLLASPKGLLPLDARIVLFGREICDSRLPRSAVIPNEKTEPAHHDVCSDSPGVTTVTDSRDAARGNVR